MSNTDCQTEEGITIGLIDSMITITRVLRERLESKGISDNIQEALDDFKENVQTDILFIKSCRIK
jgi:hypothetical protein